MRARLDAETLAAGALEWLVASARSDDDGLAWTGSASSSQQDPTLYSGGAGIVLSLLEAYAHFGDQRWADAAARGARALITSVDEWPHHSLYLGTMGIGFALHAAGDQLEDRAATQAASRVAAQVRGAFDGRQWGPQFDLLGGNAGIALGALAVGDVALAELAVTPYLHAAETTAAGVTWENRAGMRPRRHHLAHGTAGIAYALAATAQAADRADLLELALAGVDDMVSRNDADAAGFLVAHSDPQQAPDLIERYSYGWCHGPAGDAQLFRLLRRLTGGQEWTALIERCWHTVTASGLPRRLRPGFWDNSGRCCGTAGVLALACDRAAETGRAVDFADVLVDDLSQRAAGDVIGMCWSNYEHRADPPALEPRQGWAMGNAGIIRELLRYARIADGRDPGYAVQWPDQPAPTAD